MPWWFRRPSGSAHDPAVIAELHRRVDSVPPAQRLVDTMMGACSGLTPSGDNVLTRFHFASPSTRIRFEALAGGDAGGVDTRPPPCSAARVVAGRRAG
jgi:hypothetical protein